MLLALFTFSFRSTLMTRRQAAARLRYSATVDVTIFPDTIVGSRTAFRHRVMTIPTDHISNLLLSAPSHSTMRTTSSSPFLKEAISTVFFCESRQTFSVSSHLFILWALQVLEPQKALVRTLLLGGARYPQSSVLRAVGCLKPSPAHPPAGAGLAASTAEKQALLDVHRTSREGQA